MNWQPEMDLAIAAARRAAGHLESQFANDAGVRSSQGKDIKTQADVAAEEIIKTVLAPSGIPVLAEESAGPEDWGIGRRWLVDPLDGTMNFMRAFPVYAVSISLWENAKPILGVVLDLPRQALYCGVVGGGATRDGKPIRVSEVAECGQAILATGFPTGRDYGPEALEKFVGRVRSFKKIRMIGSAALSLAMVAQGTFDAYDEEDIMIWDVAAGLALVAAAGGQISIRPGQLSHSVMASASNGRVHI